MIITYLRSSSYTTYDFCAHQYFLEYVLGIDSLSNKKAEKGTIVHKTLEVLAHETLARQQKQKTYVDDVVGWDDGSQTVTGAIEKIKPDYFTKGGDRNNAENVPEFDMCKKIGCEVVFNVGGAKIQSSSDLIANYENDF